MKYIHLLILLLAISTNNIAQTKKDSLFRLYHHAKGNAQIDAQIKYARILTSADSVEVIDLLTSAIAKAKTAHYYRGQTNGYNNLGWFYFEQLHKRIPAIEFYNKALQLAKQHELNQEAFGIYLNLTDTYLFVGDNTSAINILMEGQRVAEKLGRDQYLPPIYSQLLECYGDIGDFRRAYSTFQEGLDMAQRAKNNHCIWILHLGMSEVKRKEKKIHEALAYNEKAVALGYKNHEYYAVLALQNRVELLIQDNRLTEAETICNRIKKEVKVMPAFDFIGSTNASLGQIHFVRKNYQKALFYTLESYQETLPTGNINNLLGLDSTLSKIYFELGDYRKSVESLRHLNLLKEQLFSEAKRKETENMQHHFELEKKQIAIENAESSKRTYLFLTFLLAITLILGIISFFIKQKNNTLGLKLLAETAKNQEQKREQFQFQMDIKTRELTSMAMVADQKNVLWINVRQKLQEKLKSMPNVTETEIKALDKILNQGNDNQHEWNTFKIHFDQVHPQFFKSLSDFSPNLTQLEFRQCAYIKINLTPKQVGNLLNITTDAVKKSRMRIKKKLNLPVEESLTKFIANI